jgi:hypothetical protein
MAAFKAQKTFLQAADPRLVRRRNLNVSDEWLRAHRADFPKPVVIDGIRHWWGAELRSWMRSHRASGDAA